MRTTFRANRVADAGGVGAGELETIEQGGRTTRLESAGGEGVDDDGERGLDGLAVFESAEFDVLAGDEISAGLGRIAVAADGSDAGGSGSSTTGFL